MNALDVAIIAAALVAGVRRLATRIRRPASSRGRACSRGWRSASTSCPEVVTALGGTTADGRVGVALCSSLLVASIGQAFGLVIGLLVHRVFPLPTPLPRLGPVAARRPGRLGVLVLIWMIIPSLATAQGLARPRWPAIRGSSRAIQRVAPRQPSQFAAWGLVDLRRALPVGAGSARRPARSRAPPPTHEARRRGRRRGCGASS